MKYTYKQYREDMKNPDSRFQTYAELKEAFFVREEKRARTAEKRTVIETVVLLLISLILGYILYWRLATM